MTNSRLTDPEVLEFRFPVRLDSYEIRAGSGGARPLARRRRRRAARALPRADDRLDPVATAAIRAPSARPAAAPALPGINRVERADGRVEPLDHIGSVEMAAGRRVRDRDAGRRRLRRAMTIDEIVARTGSRLGGFSVVAAGHPGARRGHRRRGAPRHQLVRADDGAAALARGLQQLRLRRLRHAQRFAGEPGAACGAAADQPRFACARCGG